MEDFDGVYTCKAQTMRFHYMGAWELRAGVIHWSARVRFLSSFWDARGTLLEDDPKKMAAAVSHSVEQWIEAFSCGRLSAR